MSLSITVRSTREFMRISTSNNIATKYTDNELGSKGSHYSSNNFQSGKGMSSFYSLPHKISDEYKGSIFSGLAPPRHEYCCVVYSTLIFLTVCFHCHALLRNVGWWLACTSVLAWDFTLVDYHILQFHHTIHDASALRVIFCLRDCNW